MTPRAYLDTSVWMAPYDDSNSRNNQPDIVRAIKRIVECHESGKIELVTSRQVMSELENHLSDSRTCNKASQALQVIRNLGLRQLPRAPADYGKAFYGEAQYNVGPKFQDAPKDEADREVMEYLTENGVDFYVSLDFEHILRESAKRELDPRLAERCRIVTPQQLIAELWPDI